MANNLNLAPPLRAVYLLCSQTNRALLARTLRPWSLRSSLPVSCPIARDHGVQGLPRRRGVRVLHLLTILDKGTPGEQIDDEQMPLLSFRDFPFPTCLLAAARSRIVPRMYRYVW